jgi:hypothetical protein
MTDEETHKREVRLAQARSHMTEVAFGLVQILGAVDAAGVLAGACWGVLAVEFDDDKARQYFREIAADPLDDADGGGFKAPTMLC